MRLNTCYSNILSNSVAIPEADHEFSNALPAIEYVMKNMQYLII